MTEHDEQAAVIQWAKEYEFIRPCLRWLHSSLNGIVIPAPIKTRAKIINYMKAEGMKPGVPDLFLPYAARGFHGLFVEMKRKTGGVVSADQDDFLRYADEAGYHCVVAEGKEHAIEVLSWYLEIE